MNLQMLWPITIVDDDEVAAEVQKHINEDIKNFVIGAGGLGILNSISNPPNMKDGKIIERDFESIYDMLKNAA